MTGKTRLQHDLLRVDGEGRLGLLNHWFIGRSAVIGDCMGYSKENLMIHTGVPSPPFPPLSPLPFLRSPCLPLPLSPSPPFLYPLPLEVGPLKSK